MPLNWKAHVQNVSLHFQRATTPIWCASAGCVCTFVTWQASCVCTKHASPVWNSGTQFIHGKSGDEKAMVQRAAQRGSASFSAFAAERAASCRFSKPQLLQTESTRLRFGSASQFGWRALISSQLLNPQKPSESGCAESLEAVHLKAQSETLLSIDKSSWKPGKEAGGGDVREGLKSYEIIRLYHDGGVLKAKHMTLRVVGGESRYSDTLAFLKR